MEPEREHRSKDDNPLNTPLFEERGAVGQHESGPIQPHAPPEGAFGRWLSVEQIRKMQRMRRETVIAAMRSGELPYEQRGRIRYARLADVLLWETRRLQHDSTPSPRRIAPELEDLA